MIAKSKKIKFGATDILLIITAIVYVVGIRGWFKVCEPMGEEFMSCHWAGEVLKAISVLMLVLSIIHIFIPDEKIKIGMDIVYVGISILALRLPAGVINLCKMDDMQCRAHTQPWNMILFIIWIILTFADIALYLSYIMKEKHKRD